MRTEETIKAREDVELARERLRTESVPFQRAYAAKILREKLRKLAELEARS
jgi:hypothetical protein